MSITQNGFYSHDFSASNSSFSTNKEFRHVSKAEPCVHCGKTDWCYILGDDLSVCKRSSEPSQGWYRTDKQDKEGTSIFARIDSKNSRSHQVYSTPQHPVKSATIKLTKLPQKPEFINVIEQGKDRRTLVYPYGENHRVIRPEEKVDGQWKKVKSGIRPQHRKGEQMINGKGDQPWEWQAYRIDEALQHCKGKWVLVVEGEKCVEVARQNQIVAITWQGGSWTEEDMTMTFTKLKKAGAEGVICFPDNDQAGYRKASTFDRVAMKSQIAYRTINPLEVWSEMPEKGDIADWLEACPEVDIEKEIIRATQAIKPIQERVKAKLPEDNNLPLVKSLNEAKSVIGQRIKLNEMTSEIELDGEPLNLDRLRLELEKKFSLTLKVAERDLQSIIGDIADENAYNPVKEYLEACRLKHSETVILDNLAERYFGVSEPIYQIYLRKFLISAVARVFEPGCKVDTSMILQSPKQGQYKSTFLQELAGESFFCDAMGNHSDKDEKLKLHMSWIHEWSEIEHAISRKETGQLKAFLSCREDLIRPPYGKSTRRMKRRCVITGTTNDSDFLKDPTGDRRFWVCPIRKEIPIDQLKKERDQIWGAATTAYLNGEQWWLSREEQDQSTQANDTYRYSSVFDELLATFLEGKDRITTQELLDWMGIDPKDTQTTNRAQKDISFSMQRLDWEKCRFVRGGEKLSGYKRDLTENSTGQGQGIPCPHPVHHPVHPQPQTQSMTQPSGQGGQGHKGGQTICETESNAVSSGEFTLGEVAKDLAERFLCEKRINLKKFFEKYSPHEARVKVCLEVLEQKNRIFISKGHIYNATAAKFKVGDKAVILEGEYKGYIGTVQRFDYPNYVVHIPEREMGLFSDKQIDKVH